MTSEWDNTPWAGSPARETRTVSGIVVRRPMEVKAVSGPGVNAYLNDIPLQSWRYGDPQQRMASFLRAYKVGWFYKAGRKISEAIGNLDWSVSDGDVESEDPAETVIGRPDLDIPFDQLTPIEQLIRLLERPNPNQTGKQLFTKTQIRRDFAGTAMWYLEGGEGGGLPTAIIGVSPARMWPSRDSSGTLIGWVLDRDRPGGGVPFSADEIITFPMASADDDDETGVGVVESVMAELPLSELMARHTTDLLTTGGRLAGMLSPKERTLTPDEFDDAVKAWRNVASDSNAAKRLLLFPEPMEYSAGASTPAEIGIPELAALNRDNILTAFPISPYQLGVPMPGGLNSGQLRREDRQDYWEGTIHPRAEALQEVIQVKLVSRYERFMGQTFDFDFDEPNLDDASAIIEKVGAFKGLVSVGFDPKEAVKAVALDQIKWLGLPAILDPAQQLAAQQAAQAALQKPDQGVIANAQGGESGDQSSTQVPVAKSTKVETKGESVVRRFLDDQRTRLSDKVRDSLPKTRRGWDSRKADLSDDAWWDGPAEDAALREALSGLYREVGRDGLQVVADKLGRFVLPTNVKRILADLVEYGGERITNINERTRDAIKGQIAEGARRGYSIEQIVSGVEAEGYPGVQAALLDNGIPAFDPYRAEMIARTETTLSFNRASIRGYGEFGVKEVQAIDGDGDEECAQRNGVVLSVEEALGITDHPNGTLDWIPVLDKAVPEDRYADVVMKALDALATKPEIHIHTPASPDVHVEGPTIPVTIEAPDVNVPPTVVNVTVPEQAPAEVRFEDGAFHIAAPEVTVEPAQVTVEPAQVTIVPPPQPDINVWPSDVTVNVPEQKPAIVNVEPPAVQVDVHVPEPRAIKRKIIRDQTGAITHIEES